MLLPKRGFLREASLSTLRVDFKGVSFTKEALACLLSVPLNMFRRQLVRLKCAAFSLLVLFRIASISCARMRF